MMDARALLMVLLTIVAGGPELPAQAPRRSATTAVLRDLGLDSLRELAGRLRQINARIARATNTSVQEPAGDDRTRYFSLLYLSCYGRAGEGLADVRAWLERQAADGFIPAAPGSRRPVSPFLAQIALLAGKQANAFTWLREAPAGSDIAYYERLRRYLDYWLNGRDGDANGLPAGRFDERVLPPADPPADTAARVESVALACLLYRECRAMAGLAHQLHRPADKAFYQQAADRLTDRLNHYLWDETAGFYHDRDELTGKPLPLKTVAGFLPLFAGMAPYDRAERLVAEHLRNPAEFWQAYPLPCSAPAGNSALNARTAVWIPANYMVFQGLMDYGYRDEARALAHRTFALVFPAAPPLRTYYDAATGQGFGPEANGAWAALAYLMPWEYELNYTPATGSWQPLIRLAPDYLGVEWREE